MYNEEYMAMKNADRCISLILLKQVHATTGLG